MKLQIFRIPMNRYAPPVPTRTGGGAFPKFGPKYEIRARVNIEVGARGYSM